MTHKPTPTRALNGKSLRVEPLNQLLEAPELLNDRLSKSTIRVKDTSTATLLLSRCQVLPEERVVHVSTTVEIQSLKEGNALLGRGSGSVRLLGRVECVDVCLVMLGVMEIHNLLTNVGFEGIVRVGERRELVLRRDDDGLVRPSKLVICACMRV